MRPQVPCECGSLCVWVAAEAPAAVTVERRMKRRKHKPTLTINKVKVVELVPCVRVKKLVTVLLVKVIVQYACSPPCNTNFHSMKAQMTRLSALTPGIFTLSWIQELLLVFAWFSMETGNS